jgi:hypothetical protein
VTNPPPVANQPPGPTGQRAAALKKCKKKKTKKAKKKCKRRARQRAGVSGGPASFAIR